MDEDNGKFAINKFKKKYDKMKKKIILPFPVDDEEGGGGGVPGGDNLKFMEDFSNLNKFSDKKHSFDDFNPEEEEDDSDDENLPNLE